MVIVDSARHVVGAGPGGGGECVLPVWRRSWKRNPAMPTLLVARRQAVYSVARRNGAPLDVVLAEHWQDVQP